MIGVGFFFGYLLYLTALILRCFASRNKNKYFACAIFSVLLPLIDGSMLLLTIDLICFHSCSIEKMESNNSSSTSRFLRLFFFLPTSFHLTSISLSYPLMLLIMSLHRHIPNRRQPVNHGQFSSCECQRVLPIVKCTLRLLLPQC